MQISKIDLCEATDFHSKQGNKITLKQVPEAICIARTSLAAKGAFLSPARLRCMRQVLRFGVNPDSSVERGFSTEFSAKDLKFKAVLHEWQMGVEMAYHSRDQFPAVLSKE